MGGEGTHWRTGSKGMAWSSGSAAVYAMRRAQPGEQELRGLCEGDQLLVAATYGSLTASNTSTARWHTRNLPVANGRNWPGL